MNETIGVKGGHNDYRKTQKIKKNKEKRLEEIQEEQEIKRLEKKVKQNQRYTLVKAMPIVIVGQTMKTLFNNTKREQSNVEVEQKNTSKEIDKDPDVIIIDEVNVKLVNTKKQPELPKKKNTTRTTQNITINKKFPEEKTEVENSDKSKPVEEATKEIKQETIPLPETRISPSDNKDYYTTDNYIDVNKSAISEDELEKLKARKIIDVYEQELKDIRYDLRKTIFEYNILVDEEKNTITSKEAEEILTRLSEVISKVEELKRRIKIDDLDKYDDNYIYTLIEDYLKEFKDKKVISEIKDSPLYILIEEKLQELDTKKDKFDKKVTEKKEKLELKEEQFELLKEKYLNINKINKNLLSFQNEQDKLLKEVKEKVANATTVQEKVEVQVEAMSRQSRRMLQMLTLSLFFPGARAAKSMAASAAAYLYFVNNILSPKTTTKKYKVITVKDYSKEIEKSIETLSDASALLRKTSKQVDKIIREVTDEFKDYLGIIKEADELLINLRKIQDEIKEKEYEMEKIQKEQMTILEKNNSKVKKIGTYPV